MMNMKPLRDLTKDELNRIFYSANWIKGSDGYYYHYIERMMLTEAQYEKLMNRPYDPNYTPYAEEYYGEDDELLANVDWAIVFGDDEYDPRADPNNANANANQGGKKVAADAA